MKKDYLRITLITFFFLALVSNLFGMSRRSCDGHYELKPLNLFVYYPIHVAYFSYEAFADKKYLLAGICDSILLINITLTATRYEDNVGIPMAFYYLNLFGLVPLMANSYVSLVESIHASDTSKMYRSIVGIAIPIIIGFMTDWSVDYCKEDKKSDLLLNPELAMEYMGMNMQYKF